MRIVLTWFRRMFHVEPGPPRGVCGTWADDVGSFCMTHANECPTR